MSSVHHGCRWLAALPLLAACADDPAAPPPPRLTGVSPATLTLDVGRDTLLTVERQGTGALAVTWRSDAPTVATVDAEGRVRAVAPGSARVVVRSATDSAVARLSVVTPPCVLVLDVRPARVELPVGRTIEVPVALAGGCGPLPAATAWRFASRDAALLRVASARDSVVALETLRASTVVLEVRRESAAGLLTALIPVTLR